MNSDRWPRLRPLLDRALELEGEARRAYVASLDADDADLRPALERLLVEQEALASRTMSSAMELVLPAVVGRLRDDAALDEARVGQSIGPYHLVRLLGAGGMGAVYLAERREDGFAQTVALKIVRPSLGTPAARDHFERERQILAGLTHPGIALLFDGGQTDEYRSFYTMEYVDGESIIEYCDRRELPTRSRVELLLEVAKVLSYAHQNLVVHRDIKPSNVLVTKEGRIKLIDFGLAKLIDEHVIASVTQTGLGPMTPVYAAPEQFHGRPTAVATDIYQFGALCFLTLTSHLPYRADPEDALEWARAVTEQEPMTLARAAVESARHNGGVTRARSTARQLTADLDAVVRKCLEKSPEQRYRSADALSTDLEAFLADRPVSARASGPVYFAWRFVKRRRYAVGAAALALGALSVAGIVTLQQWRLAARQAERAEREAAVRDVTRAMLTDLLREGPAGAASAHPRSALEALDQGAERVLRTLGDNAPHRAMAAGVLSESYLDLDHPQRARALIESTSRLIDGIDGLRADALQLELLLARAAVDLGDIAASQRALATAAADMRTLNVSADSPARLAERLVEVKMLIHEGRQPDAREAALRLLHDSDRPPLDATLEFANLLRVVARLSVNEDTAASLFLRASKISAAHYGADSPAALSDERKAITHDLGGAHLLDTDRLLANQRTRIAAAFGSQSLDYADVLYIDCDRYFAAKEYAKSEACWREVLAIREQAPDAEDLVAVAYDNIAANLIRQGKPVDALAFYERELAARSRNFAPGNLKVIHSRLQIAIARCLAGDIDEATRAFNAAIDDFVRSVGPHHPWEPAYAASFTTCLLDAHRVDSARTLMERHGRLDPPPKDMTSEERASVLAVWKRLGD